MTTPNEVANELADDLVDAWHASATPLPLHEFMLLTKAECDRWAADAVLPADFAERHARGTHSWECASVGWGLDCDCGLLR